MERRGEKVCKTFNNAPCAYVQAQKLEIYLKEVGKTPILFQYILFVHTYLKDTQRLNLMIEADKCTKCTYKPRS